jgi:hypothetical protein
VSEPLAIVGNGMAAARLVDELTAPLRLNVPGAGLPANCSIPPISLTSRSGIARVSADVQRPASTR